jgi:hypothetical protein
VANYTPGLGECIVGGGGRRTDDVWDLVEGGRMAV